MKAELRRKILWGAGSVLMLLLSIYTLCNAEMQLGEYILYGLTALVIASFISCFFSLGNILRNVRTVTTAILTGYFVAFILLVYACRTDRVSYTEKYAMVLGAPVRSWRVSAILEERIDTAADFMKKDPAAVAVLTGGNSPYRDTNTEVSEVTTEAAYMTMAMVAEGVDPERLFLEGEAETTEENFSNSVALLRDAGYTDGQRIVIITNRFHAFRVRQYAKEAGLTNFAIFPTRQKTLSGVAWYLREIPVSVVFFVNHILLGKR